MAPPLYEADHELISQLQALSRKNKRLVNSSVYEAPADPHISVRSWKMNEFKYYDVPSPFPTLARGLFTTWVPKVKEGKSLEEKEDGEVQEPAEEGEIANEGRNRIVARGYDKFFNIGEVPWTTWDALRAHTKPPYVMTLKSNGCIIFIGALTPNKLLVTSKHSLGPIQGVKISHAQMGEKWLRKHLERAGKTTEQLAQVLWDNNWTAVAELCDDSFEEHVLPIPYERTGLHLHGVNESTGSFKTLPSDEVNKFAREWGFLETAFHVADSVDEVKNFSEEVSKSGKWNGEAIEGFVVRCHVSAEPVTNKRTAPPYPPNSSFFFKVKFDEPYMMYRDWREVTKVLLSAKGRLEDVKIPKSKLRRPETAVYLKWVREEIKRDMKPFENYTKGRGIIATRERFLEWLKKKDGSQQLESEQSEQKLFSPAQQTQFGKTIIVTVAIPGCGKTTVAVALRQLFGFGHVQSDDIQAKNRARAFVQKVVNELRNKDVVIADKNNHLRQHREELATAVANHSPPVRLLAFNWALDKPPAMIHRICSDRVLQRGENHQTLRADTVKKAHEEILWRFIDQSEELAEREVHDVVDMDIEDDIERSLDRAIDACARILGLPKPSQEDIGKALAAARNYAVKVKTKQQGQKKEKTFQPRYYAFLPEVDLGMSVGDVLEKDDAPEAAKTFWKSLRVSNRVAKVPHITIVHKKSLPEEQGLWDRCRGLFELTTPPVFEIELGDLVYDSRVMAIAIKGVRAAASADKEADPEAESFAVFLPDELKERLHITVGTASADINPFEARSLVERWRAGNNSKDIGSVSLGNVKVKGTVRGLMS